MNGLETHWGASVIAVGNQKGGVGKTTTSVHLARGLADLGHRVLLWDLDPSAGATKHLGVPPEVFCGTFEVLMGELKPHEAVFTGDEEFWMPDGLALIPASRILESIDRELLRTGRMTAATEVLAPAIDEFRTRFDVILLDTPPSTVLSPSLSAYRVSDWFILAATPDPLAITALNDAADDITKVRRHANPGLSLLGVVVNAADKRTRLTRELTEYLDMAFRMPDGNTLRLEPSISRSTIVPTAQKAGRTVFDTAPGHQVAEQYRELSRVVEQRLIIAQAMRDGAHPEIADEAA